MRRERNALATVHAKLVSDNLKLASATNAYEVDVKKESLDAAGVDRVVEQLVAAAAESGRFKQPQQPSSLPLLWRLGKSDSARSIFAAIWSICQATTSRTLSWG